MQMGAMCTQNGCDVYANGCDMYSDVCDKHANGCDVYSDVCDVCANSGILHATTAASAVMACARPAPEAVRADPDIISIDRMR